MGLIDKVRNSITLPIPKKRGSTAKASEDEEAHDRRSSFFPMLQRPSMLMSHPRRTSHKSTGSGGIDEDTEVTDGSMDNSSGLFAVVRNGLMRRGNTENQVQKEVYLLDRLGGMDVLGSIVNDFVSRITHDKRLMVFFEGVDFQILAAHQKSFFAMAFTKVPEGKSLETIIKVKHQHLFEQGLNETHYDIVIFEHMMGALKKRGFNQAIMDEVANTIAPLRKVFVTATKKASWNGRVPTVMARQSQMIHAS